MNATSRIIAATLFGASLFVSAPVFAQGGGGGGAQAQAQSRIQAPDPSEVSDAQLEKFSEAQSDVREVRKDWQDKLQNAESQEKAMQNRQKATQEMVEAVRDSGLSVDEYNGIAKAAQSNPEFAKRVQDMR